jgi:drug/metabolite transporter (DMT)-like permease
MINARLEKGFWGAALLTILGAGIAIWGRSGASGQGLMVGGGEPLIILSFVAWTAFSILSVRWFPAETPQMARHFLTSLGAIPWLVLWWLLARAFGLAGEPQLHPDATALTYLLITAAFSTALGGVAWNFGVARMGINAGVMWQNTVPVFAVLISLIFFGQVPLVEQVIGGAVVLVGVLYMQWQRMRSAAARGA